MQKYSKFSHITSPYERMYKVVSAAHTPNMYLSMAGIVALVFSVLSFLSNINNGWDKASSVAFLAFMVGFGLAACLIIIFIGLGYGQPEMFLLREALLFLREQKFDDNALESIKLRAEIGSSISPVRNFIPILAIPIAISFVSSFQNVSFQSWLFIGYGFLFLLLPLTVDTYKSSIDHIIRHALAEHLYEKLKTRQSIKNSDLYLLRLLLTQI